MAACMNFLAFRSLCLSSFTTLFEAILWRLEIGSLFGLEGQFLIAIYIRLK